MTTVQLPAHVQYPAHQVGRAREAIDGQHESLQMIRTMLPRAAAAATGRLEAAAQRSEFLTRRMLDLEVSFSVGTELGEGYRPVGFGYPPTPHTPRTPTAAALAAGGTPQARTYEAGVAALNEAHREVTEEVQEALLALRGRIDELLAFARGPPAAATGAAASTAIDAETPRPLAADLHAPVWATPPRRS